ncbi:acyl-CoA thioesterase [Yaniella halotolerans]|uniref:acyl-CoA thioesterase n=1 Tax=Yaniella halotolerans TaxID=225453 RepID=UPI0003B77333|nr:acyl-CoA thioesterase [Yaniella halotolerans]
MSDYQEITSYATDIEVQIRWSDQDVNGHVNNVRIMTLFEEARVRAMQQWTGATPDGTGYRRAVRALTTTYDREVQYGRQTTIWVWISRIGNTSFVVSHLLVQNDQPCVYTETTMVVVDTVTGKPRPHDAAYRRELEDHAGPAYSGDHA